MKAAHSSEGPHDPPVPRLLAGRGHPALHALACPRKALGAQCAARHKAKPLLSGNSGGSWYHRLMVSAVQATAICIPYGAPNTQRDWPLGAAHTSFDTSLLRLVVLLYCRRLRAPSPTQTCGVPGRVGGSYEAVDGVGQRDRQSGCEPVTTWATAALPWLSRPPGSRGTG